MALVGIELETLVSESDALATRPPPCADYFLAKFQIFFFYYRSICIIDDGASRRRTRNTRFRARRADHSTTSMCNLPIYVNLGCLSTISPFPLIYIIKSISFLWFLLYLNSLQIVFLFQFFF